MTVSWQGVTKTFPSGDSARGGCTIHCADATVDAGQACLIKGASGQGKSTMMAMIGGLLPVTSGHITIAHGHGDRDPEQARREGLVAYAFSTHSSPRTSLSGRTSLCAPKPRSRISCWPLAAWLTWPISRPARCPVGSSSGWPSSGLWRRGPQSCWQMSRRHPLTTTIGGPWRNCFRTTWMTEERSSWHRTNRSTFHI